MFKIYIVLLHYQAIEDTNQCVESIKNNLSYDNLYITIVDNASPNNSGRLLEELYKDEEKINVILNQNNLGFARGNNIGYKYAKDNDADFIIQANNDTLFNDRDFITTMLDIFKNERYGVLGPDVISTKDHLHQNPAPSFFISKKNIKKQRLKALIGLLLSYFNFDVIVKNLIKKKKYDYSIYTKRKEISNNDNFVLHGSCLVFSPLYIEAIDGMFPDTFMYYEENILKYMCIKENIKIVYSPKLNIEHKCKTATTIVKDTEIKKRRFFYIESIRSLTAFLNIYE